MKTIKVYRLHNKVDERIVLKLCAEYHGCDVILRSTSGNSVMSGLENRLVLADKLYHKFMMQCYLKMAFCQANYVGTINMATVRKVFMRGFVLGVRSALGLTDSNGNLINFHDQVYVAIQDAGFNAANNIELSEVVSA